MKKLYFGGTILTMDQELYAEAVLTENDKILAIGNKEVLAETASGAECIDLDGTTLMPGFIDAHSHYSQVAAGLLQVSLNELDSTTTIRDRISEFVKKNGISPGDWIIASDFDQNNMPGGKYLLLSQLDELAPQNPLILRHKSGHSGLFNSQALKKLGVTESSVAPEGGKIEKKEGHLTGLMEENAFFHYLEKVPTPEPEKMLSMYEQAQEQYASNGITTIQEGMFVKQMAPLYEMILKKEILKLDLVAYSEVKSIELLETVFPTHINKYNGHFKIGGLKIFLDGSPQGKTAWMSNPYSGETSYCGYGTMSDEDVCNAILSAAKLKLQLIAHCNGDAACEQLIRCMECCKMKLPSIQNMRTVIIHAQFLQKNQIKRAAELGIIASFFVAHVWYWGDTHIKNLGFERASRMSPAASALSNGLLFTFHQDAPVIQPNMLETIWSAVCRRTKSGVDLKEEKISVLEALKAVTVNGAFQYFEEDKKGTISPGKKADFVILDRNPLEVPLEELRKIVVLQTIKDGKCIFRRNL